MPGARQYARRQRIPQRVVQLGRRAMRWHVSVCAAAVALVLLLCAGSRMYLGWGMRSLFSCFPDVCLRSGVRTLLCFLSTSTLAVDVRSRAVLLRIPVSQASATSSAHCPGPHNIMKTKGQQETVNPTPSVRRRTRFKRTPESSKMIMLET